MLGFELIPPPEQICVHWPIACNPKDPVASPAKILVTYTSLLLECPLFSPLFSSLLCSFMLNTCLVHSPVCLYRGNPLNHWW